MTEPRTEFGASRPVCACRGCVKNCRFMPGYLIPADLKRMMPPVTSWAEALVWAEENLLSSPGALVRVANQVFTIPTLVPRVKPDGSCIHLIEGRCGIHAIAPFACAFFSCQPEPPGLAIDGIYAVYAELPGSLYKRFWQHLNATGRVQENAAVLRGRMDRAE